MIEKIRFILYFVVLLLVQSLILDQICLNEYINAFVYVLFIMTLPIDTNKYLVLLLGLAMGLCVDLFDSTLGLHASGGVLVAFIRPFILSIYAPHDGYENNKDLSIRAYGFSWFTRYCITMLLIHHTWIFFFENFSFANILFTLGKIGVSTLTSYFVIVIFHLLLMRRK
ncbi:MAG: rod shape-determining protein MreD [Bacteroidales bacterium]|nr:rod shape-determining protein MreD [Bacteroidales bacterium]